MRSICKQYSVIQALYEAGLEVRAGEGHVLLGEDGAGKSTLMILSGAGRPAAARRGRRGRPEGRDRPRDEERDDGQALKSAG
jgi:ribose transport system ATP-binding protein